MLGSLVKRDRRPLWGAISVLLLFAIGASVYMGARARSSASAEAARDAELIAQTELAPLLMPRDLMAPIVDERATELGELIEATITSSGDVGRVRIYSSLGRILYATETNIVGTRPSYLRDLTFDVVNGDTQTQIHSGLLQTYVPIWLSPDGTVVVAEMSQPYGPIAAAASRTWNQLALACVVLLLGGIAMIVTTSLSRASGKTSVPVYAPQAPVRQPRDLLAPAADAPIYQQAGFRVVEEQRLAAESRASAAEENYRSVQQQLKATLGQMKDLEGRLAMQESHATTNDAELQALRQRELEEARHQVASIRAEGSDAEELKQRLVAAERRAGELARQAERPESELDHTKSKLHMTKLSEALREFDSDEIDIDIEVGADEDDLFEHPVIIRGNGFAS